MEGGSVLINFILYGFTLNFKLNLWVKPIGEGKMQKKPGWVFKCFFRILFVMSLVESLTACGAGNGEGLGVNGLPLDPNNTEEFFDTAVQPTLNSIQEKVFGKICAECHVGAAAPEGLRLDSKENSFALMVSFVSNQDVEFARIEPGNADNSYLIKKLEGTAFIPTQMPLGQPALSEETINAVRTWIQNGALFDE